MLKKVFNTIKEFFKQKCPYAKTCEFYAEENKTCQSPTAESDYCGHYRNLLEQDDQKEKK